MKQSIRAGLLFGLLSLFFCVVVPSFSDALTYVDSCRTLNSAGETYIVNVSNLTSTGTCITISAANITFDCNNSKIFAASASGYGITLGVASSGSLIQNCNVSTTASGTYAIYGDAAFTNVTIDNCVTQINASGAAMYFRSCTNVTITDSLAYTYSGASSSLSLASSTSGFKINNVTAYAGASSGIALKLVSSNYNNISNSSFSLASSSNGYCVQLDGATNNNIIDSNISTLNGYGVYLNNANSSDYFYFVDSPKIRVRFFDLDSWYSVANVSNGVVFSSKIGASPGLASNFTVNLLTADLVSVDQGRTANSHYDYYLKKLQFSVLYFVKQDGVLLTSNFTDSNGTLYTFLERLAAGNGQLNFSVYGVPIVTPTPAVYAFTRPIPTVPQEDSNPYTGFFILKEFKITTGSIGLDMYGFMIGCILLFAGVVHFSRDKNE